MSQIWPYRVTIFGVNYAEKRRVRLDRYDAIEFKRPMNFDLPFCVKLSKKLRRELAKRRRRCA